MYQLHNSELCDTYEYFEVKYQDEITDPYPTQYEQQSGNILVEIKKKHLGIRCIHESFLKIHLSQLFLEL